MVIDIEVYPNYFLCVFYKNLNDIHYFEMWDNRFFINDLEINRLEFVKSINDIYSTKLTIGFNSLSYDLPIIVFLKMGANNKTLKSLSDEIIKSNERSWKILKNKNLFIPKEWDHIDIIEVAPSIASLKIYGGRLNFKSIQDLPIELDKTIDQNDREKIKSYCVNDCEITLFLYNNLEKQMLLREKMSKEYGIDLRSKSDAQIAEQIVKSEIRKVSNKQVFKNDIEFDTFKFQPCEWLEFKTDDLKHLYETVLTTEFSFSGDHILKFFKSQKIKIGETNYVMGKGGLHSCEKNIIIDSCDDFQLIDLDVASYYPSIILNQKLSPKCLGDYFFKVYSQLIDRRLSAKASGDKITSDALKISINGIYGKFGNRYSILYAPDLLLQTTITGQLTLLMLIESLELSGFSVVSANTDGIVVKCHDYEKMQVVCFNWFLKTDFVLEETRYKKLVSRDVNNYIAIKVDGRLKRKGVFSPPNLTKNPDAPIIYEAICNYFSNNTPIEETILNCKDVFKFVLLRRVTGGAMWEGEHLGRAVRYYYSSVVPDHKTIQYAKNSNKVPKSNGCRPLMTIESFPDDIHYERYIAESKKILSQLTSGIDL